MGTWETDNTGNYGTVEQTVIQRNGETEKGRGTDTGFTAKATNSFIQQERKRVRDRERERHWHRFYCKGHQPYRIEGEKGRGTDTGFTAKATNSFIHNERKEVRERKGDALTQVLLQRPPTIQNRRRERERHRHRFYCKGHQPYRIEGEKGRGTDTGFTATATNHTE